MGNEWLKKRSEHELKAAKWLESNHDPAMKMLGEVLGDLGPELKGLTQLQQDMRLAGEMSYRIDKLVRLGDPIAEALDGPIAFFVSLGVIGIYRAVIKKKENRSKTLSQLKDRLASEGEFYREGRKRRLSKRIARLERLIARDS